MGKKVVFGALSAVLLVAVVVGVVAGVMRSQNRAGDNFSVPSGGDSSDGLSTTSKAVAALCAPTSHQEVCVRTLSKVANGNISTEGFIEAAINATVSEINAAYAKRAELSKNFTDPKSKLALKDCEDLLQDASDELSAVVASATGNPKEISKRFDDLATWLSAVITYQDTCLDGLAAVPEVNASMAEVLDNGKKLASNVIAIVDGVTKIFRALPLDDLKLPEYRRRLMGLDDGVLGQNADGFPAWMSAGDRRLLASRSGAVRPNAVVAQDGSGNYRTINQAVNSIPSNHRGRWVIYVKAGVYREYVIIPKDKVNVFMYGDGSKKTVVTGHKSNGDGYSTKDTATFTVEAKGFLCKGMSFRNTAGPEKHQAVALLSKGDMSAFFNCRLDAYQDTLYVQAQRQFYRNCVIAGTVDFIFGDAAAIIQNSLLIVRRPMDSQQNIVTAQGRSDAQERSGIVIHNCRIVPERRLFPVRFKIPTYLGRPWKDYSRTIIMESLIGDLVRPEGYLPWDDNSWYRHKTLYYAEYANRGPGAVTRQRVNWPGFHVLRSRQQAMPWTVGSFIQGGQWLRYTGGRYILGLKY